MQLTQCVMRTRGGCGEEIEAAVTSSSAAFITTAFIMSLEGANVVYYSPREKLK